MSLPWILLSMAIGIEVASTALLPRTEGFRNPLWTASVLLGYALSFWLLAVVVQNLPVSVVYAIWSGLGTAAIAVVGPALSSGASGPGQGGGYRDDHRWGRGPQPARGALTLDAT